GSFGWQWLADEMIDQKLDPHLANCRKVDHWREARGVAKNNRIDADLLSELWPQEPRWWEVWLAPQPVRDRRELLRYRMGLVQIQTMTKNRIHAVLHRYGIIPDFSRLFTVQGREYLKALAKAEQPLRANARLVLAGQLRLLEQVRKQIATVTGELRRQVGRDAQAELWRSLPGIDWVLAYTIHAEVGDAGRFRSGRRLASYSLLAPICDDSGDEQGPVPLGRHVGHQGRQTLQWAFIEAARAAVRRRDPLLLGIFNRRTDQGTRDKNRGYIAVARKLAEVGLSCVKHRRGYQAVPPPRPGSVAREALNQEVVEKKKSKAVRKSTRTSVPSLGQPEDPMADAGV
ncbi:MAG TPA: transposase, partial [Tepidisphaeraceae bacterium]|nr:transposase [Tepidisphaeraceae bacterium]